MPMPTRLARLALRSVLAASLVLVGVPAQAQSSPNAALAERLFREGRALLEAGDTAPACQKFAESEALDPALGTLLNLAECEARLGRTASAWAHFRELAEKARRAEQTDRQTYAERRASELEGRLTYARLRFPAGAVVDLVLVDGQPLGAASYSTALPLDPGPHRVEVRVGSDRYVMTFELPAQPGQVPIDLMLDEEHRVGGAPKPPGDDDAPLDGRLVAGWVLVGVAAIGAGLGTYFGVQAMSRKDESDARCDRGVCDPIGLAAYDDARMNAHGATASFVISGAAALTGVSLLVWAAVEGPPAGAVSISGRF